MKNKLFFYLLLACSLLFQIPMVFAQESVIIKGKIVSETTDLDGISIINIQSDYATSTEKGGYFEINASLGDTLVFSGIQFEKKKMVISKEVIKTEELIVKLQLKIRQIEEVVVENKINAVSLGIVPKNQKKYTVAERRLKTAGDFKPQQLLGILGGSLPIDPIINAINGKTKKLKKEIEIEKKELLFKKISIQFENDYFTKTLKIPDEYLTGFKYYLIDNGKFSEAMNNENKNLATFFMGEIATEYLSLLNNKQ